MRTRTQRDCEIYIAGGIQDSEAQGLKQSCQIRPEQSFEQKD